jgi:hypothetical protein
MKNRQLALAFIPCFVAGLGYPASAETVRQRAAEAQDELSDETDPTPRPKSPPPPPAAQPPAPAEPAYQPPPPAAEEEAISEPPPIPPNAEGTAYAAPSGGYCYVGAHPADSRYGGGETWDGTPGMHSHPYPPFDLRLFELRDNCYYFIGDPRDFGYQGRSYSYYGAHPILATYGGGWCFMIGQHSHLWSPWSTNFALVGSSYYWEGPYDAHFWSYWPYYSHYYRNYYPNYYAGGRFYRGGYRPAPAIQRVPPPARGAYGQAAVGWRSPPQPAAWHGSPAGPHRVGVSAPPAAPYRPAPAAAPPAAPYRAAPPAATHGGPPAAAFHRAPQSAPPPAPSRAAAPAMPAPAPRPAAPSGHGRSGGPPAAGHSAPAPAPGRSSGGGGGPPRGPGRRR